LTSKELEEAERTNALMIEASDKSNIHMHESVIELTILSFLKTAVKKNTIDKEK